ncbi:MAG: dUTP diphosphatase [Paraclostridium sp.]
MRIRGFETVISTMRKNTEVNIELPTRGTSKAMAYDFYSPINLTIQPGEIGKIWTDVKAYMQDTECLVLNVRSSQGGKVMMANTQGWIDGDYFSNESNDGNIGIFLKNIGDKPYEIKIGDRIAQGAFFSFLVSDNGNNEEVRTGGFGSTNK